MVTINVYDKGQVDAIAATKADITNVYTKTQVDTIAAGKMNNVNTSGASEGDVLTLDANLNPTWQTGGSGGVTKHTYSTFAALRTDIINHWKDMVIVYRGDALNTIRYAVTAQAYYISDSIVGIAMSSYWSYGSSGSDWDIRTVDISLTASSGNTVTASRNTLKIRGTAAVTTTNITFNIADFVVYY